MDENGERKEVELNGEVSEAFEIVSSIVDDIPTVAVTGTIHF